MGKKRLARVTFEIDEDMSMASTMEGDREYLLVGIYELIYRYVSTSEEPLTAFGSIQGAVSKAYDDFFPVNGPFEHDTENDEG